MAVNLMFHCTFETFCTTQIQYPERICILVCFLHNLGLGDPKGRDSQHIADMVKHLKEVGQVNAFLLVLNRYNI